MSGYVPEPRVAVHACHQCRSWLPLLLYLNMDVLKYYNSIKRNKHVIFSCFDLNLPHSNVEDTCEWRTILKQNSIEWRGRGEGGDERRPKKEESHKKLLQVQNVLSKIVGHADFQEKNCRSFLYR